MKYPAITLNLTPQLTTWAQTQADAEGLTPVEWITRLIDEHRLFCAPLVEVSEEQIAALGESLTRADEELTDDE